MNRKISLFLSVYNITICLFLEIVVINIANPNSVRVLCSRHFFFLTGEIICGKTNLVPKLSEMDKTEI